MLTLDKLDKLFTLTAQHGTQTVFGQSTGAVVAGLGHVLLTVGLVLLFIGLGKRVSAGVTAGPAR